MGKGDKASFSLARGLAFLAALAYFVLATYRIDFQSIWYDEGLTLHYSSLPLVEGLSELASQSVHPPLYFVLMHFWLKVAGDSDLALRFLSAIFGALLVSASFTFGSRLANPRLGALLAILTASSPFVVYYGQEARMYTAVAFLSTLTAIWAIDIVRKGRGYRGYTVASCLAVLTHYFAFLVLGSQLVIAVPLLYLQKRHRDIAKLIGALALVALVFLPWTMSFFRVAATHEDFWREKLSFTTMVQDAILHFSLGEVAWPDNVLIFIFYGALVLGLLGILRRSLRIAILTSAIAFVVSFVALTVFPKAVYVARYMLVVAPAFYLLVAAGVYNLGSFISLVQPKRTVAEKAVGYFGSSLAVILAILVIGSNAVSMLTTYYNPASYRREDFKSLSKYLEPRVAAGDGMVFVAGPLGYALYHYLPKTGPSVWVDSNVRLGPNDKLPELADFLNRGDVKRVWLVRSLVSADDLVDPDRITQKRIMDQFGVITALKDVHGLVVEAYDGALYQDFRQGTQVNITFGTEVRLPKYYLAPSSKKPGDRVVVELFWEPMKRVTRLWWVSLQLVERASGKMVALADFPAGGLVPTTTWGPGMRVGDKATLTIPADASLGDYDAYLIVYDPATGERLPVTVDQPGSQPDTGKLFSLKLAN